MGWQALLNLEDIPLKRRKGSMMWSGMANTHWAYSSESVRATGVPTDAFGGLIGNPVSPRRCSLQAPPPFDSVAIDMFDELERAVYKSLVA